LCLCDAVEREDIRMSDSNDKSGGGNSMYVVQNHVNHLMLESIISNQYEYLSKASVRAAGFPADNFVVHLIVVMPPTCLTCEDE